MSKLGAVLSNPEMTEKIRKIVTPMMPAASEPNGENPPQPLPASSPPSSPPIPYAHEIPSTIKNGKMLLIALKPYLDPERCGKIDRILDAMKLAEFAGFFKNLL